MTTELVRHAEAELELLGVDPAVRATLVAAVAAYASCRPSPDHHRYLSALLLDLLARRPLTPLTANPAEWVDRSEAAGAPLWQNLRDPRALSEDGGRSYRFEDGADARTFRSAPPRGWVLALRERDGMSEQLAVDAIWEYLDSGPMTDGDMQMLAALPAGALRWDYMAERWGRLGAAVAGLMYGSEPAAAAQAVQRPLRVA